MKTSLLDYLLATLALSLVLAGSGGAVWGLSTLSSGLFGDYHVFVDLGLALLCFGVLAALVIRALLWWRPIRPGTYSMDSPTFVHWKLITVLSHFGQTALIPLTPIFFRPLVSMLYGARLGSGVAIGGILEAPFFIKVGAGSAIGNASLVTGNFTQGKELICGTVKIGAGVTVGVNSVVFPNTVIGDNVTLVGGSYVMPGTKIPAGETWRGNPARKWL